MSDGLTDGYRSTLMAQRRNTLFRSVIDSLKDRLDTDKRGSAMNDIMAFENSLHGRQSGKNREISAAAYLDHLQQGDRGAWVKLLAFALRSGATQDFWDLKELSPFRGTILVLADSSGKSLKLISTIDLEHALGDELKAAIKDQDPHQHLIAIDFKIISARDVKT